MRSKVLCVSNIFSTAYVIYFWIRNFRCAFNAAYYYVFNRYCIRLARFFIIKSWAALTFAILYAVGTLFFPAYFMFGVPILTIGFIGFSKQRKLNSQVKAETAGN